MLEQSFTKGKIEVGCDEAGRGCLSGPVVAAAVILRDDVIIEALNDSKKLSEKKRNILQVEIKEKALTYGIGVVSQQEIDEINILNASFLAMHRAIENMNTPPELILVDGNRFTSYKNIAHECIIKGDGKYMSIAAASILAKTHRDELMVELDSEFPQYGWAKNKGYPTKVHRAAIKEHGINIHHRKSFNLLGEK